MLFLKKTLLTTTLMVSACAPAATLSGGAMLNVQPTASPSIVGNYDFDLLDPVRGKACVRTTVSGSPQEYWMGILPFQGKLPGDALTIGAIAAASTDAIDQIAGADTILLTRVITEGKSSDEVCAYVYGRAVRLKKANARGSHEVDDDDEGTAAPTSEHD